MKKLASLTLIPLVASLTACGGSDNNDSGQPVIPAAAASISGELEAVSGSILNINGRSLDAAGARFEGTSLSELKPGMVLDIKTEKGIATDVILNSELQAPVSNIDGDVLTMAGIRVLTKEARFDDGLSLSAIKVGDMLEVSGFYLDGDQLKASFIEQSDDSHSELEGVVTALSTAAKQFKLGKVTVDYSASSISLNNGDLVEVEGLLDGLNLKACSIEKQNREHNQGDEIEAEGLISWMSQDGSHLLLNQQTSVAITGQTRFEDGSAADLKVGNQIEVEGSWDLGAMNLVAKEIEFEHKGDIGFELDEREFEAPGFATLDANGRISLNGISLTLSSAAEFDDLLPADVNGSNWVSLSGYEQAGEFIVTEIETELQSVRIELEGEVQAFDAQAGLFGYQTVDGSLNAFVGKHGEFECTLGANQQISGCVIDN